MFSSSVSTSAWLLLVPQAARVVRARVSSIVLVMFFIGCLSWRFLLVSFMVTCLFWFAVVCVFCFPVSCLLY